MQSLNQILLGLIGVFLLISCSDTVEKTGIKNGPLFKKLSESESGITFKNDIKESPTWNHLVWNSVYSGAGVAVGDINNDGLEDIFYSGNIVNDALYLNKGNMQFEDISQSAGVGANAGWSNGATFVDINQDGYLDIYVCRSDKTDNPNNKRNLLYINQGNNTFKEEAKAYGLDDGGYSMQASFFDLDNDGDLDVFLGNQPPDGRLLSRLKIDLNAPGKKAQYTDKLFRNIGNGKFVDISKAAGVSGYGHALSVVVSDVNGDNLSDIYVSNDYDAGDFLYINNGDLTFTNKINESIKHISNFAMGCDIADFNNDGLLDISVVDMAAEDHFRSKTNMGSMDPKRFWDIVERGDNYQYMFNTLQLNNGNNTFSEVSQIAGISKTDWSWSTLMADFDNDGFKDIFITNGIQRDMRNNDFQYKIKALNEKGQTQFNIMDVVNLVPSVPVPNYLFKNNGDLTFSNKANEWGVDQPGFSNGMAYADFDNDGDLDFVLNNVSDFGSVYENIQGNKNNYIRFSLNSGKNENRALNAKVKIKYGDQNQIIELTRSRGYLSASENKAHFGLGDVTKVDEVIVIWNNGQRSEMKDLEANKTYTINLSDAKTASPSNTNQEKLFAEINDSGIDFKHIENEFDDYEREILLPHKQSQHGPHVVAGDVNQDGLEDVFVGGASGSAGMLYLQSKEGKFSPSNSNPWSADKESEDLGGLFFDADGDKDLDLYIVSGGAAFKAGDTRYQDRFYLNDGKGNFTKKSNALPRISASGEKVIANDFDGDGDLDLFVGGRIIPGKYPSPAESYLLENDKGIFKDVTNDKAPELKNIGMITDAIFSDVDGDKDMDLLAVGEWMEVSVFKNENGSFVHSTKEMGLSDTRGWWWSINEGDFDNDGDMDYVIGNMGKNKKFKASKEKPFIVYGNDFDDNGSNDIVLANYYGDNVVPVRGRQCSSEQMPFIGDKFPTFEGFANATVESILPEEGLKSAIKYEVKNFQSIVLMNEEGSFKTKKLPVQAQFAPLRDTEILDINQDGNMDIVGVGNMYPVEVETIRYDAGIGVCLLGQGNGEFKALPISESGFFAAKDARSIARVKGTNELFIVGNNNDKLQIFKRNKTIQ